MPTARSGTYSPPDIAPLIPVLRNAGAIFALEDSTAGGTWGSDIAQQIHTRLWKQLKHPVTLIHAPDCVIPAAAHLEHEVMVNDRTVHGCVLGVLYG